MAIDISSRSEILYQQISDQDETEDNARDRDARYLLYPVDRQPLKLHGLLNLIAGALDLLSRNLEVLFLALQRQTLVVSDLDQ